MTNSIRTNVEEIIKGVELTKNEWNVIKMIRQIRFGQVLVVKNGGIIARAEITKSILVTEQMDTDLEIDVQ